MEIMRRVIFWPGVSGQVPRAAKVQVRAGKMGAMPRVNIWPNLAQTTENDR